MCDFFGISRAAYYKWVKRCKKPDPDLKRKRLVQEAWLKSRKTYGYRRVTLYLQQQGNLINHKAVLRLMRKLHIRSVARKRKPYKKASQMETHHLYQNALDRDFTAIAPNRKWVTDISYVLTQQGWAYLSTIKDLFDGFVVAHLVGRENNIALVTNTLKLAIRREKITEKLLLHSDQGFHQARIPISS
jgi:putative transposase